MLWYSCASRWETIFYYLSYRAWISEWIMWFTMRGHVPLRAKKPCSILRVYVRIASRSLSRATTHGVVASYTPFWVDNKESVRKREERDRGEIRPERIREKIRRHERDRELNTLDRSRSRIQQDNTTWQWDYHSSDDFKIWHWLASYAFVKE